MTNTATGIAIADSVEELFSAIGGALHQWSGVEFALSGLFEIISGIPSPKKSNAVFDTIISFEVRVDIIDSLMTFETFSDLDRETWNKFAPKLKKKYKKRHEIAHFTILPNAEVAALSPFYTFGTELRDEVKTLSSKEIRDRKESFAGFHQAVNWFKYEAMKRRRLIEDNPIPMPQPVVRCRESAALLLEERAHKKQQSTQEKA